MEETRVPGENHKPVATHWQTIYNWNPRLLKACTHLIYIGHEQKMYETPHHNVLSQSSINYKSGHVGWHGGSLETYPNDNRGQVGFKLAKCFHRGISNNIFGGLK